MNIEEAIPASGIVGVWPTEAKGTFIPDPYYHKSDPTVYNVSLRGAFEIKEVF